MKQYYLNTYDAESRFNIDNQEAEKLFDKIEMEMSNLGYNVVKECVLNSSNNYDDIELEMNVMKVLKKLDLA